MNRYMESNQAKHEYFENEMLKHKEKALKKFMFISDDYEIREKFAKMMIDAEYEKCSYAEEFIEYFMLDAIDKMAILEELECFTEELNKERENNYCEDHEI